MFLETVWSALAKGEWKSTRALREASGLDEDTLTRVINFLIRWKFVETKEFPSFCIRRKAGAISPIEVFNLLRAVTETQPSLVVPNERRRLVERVACRTCQGRSLTFVGENQVECNRCHERQWFAIETEEPKRATKKSGSTMRLRLLLQRMPFSCLGQFIGPRRQKP